MKKRVKTPTILQMEAVECGAASLAIIMAYYGRIVPLEQLRIDCGISRDGSKASNLLKAARTYGFTANGYRHDIEDLRGMRLPVMIFWNFNHFVVLEGFGRGRAYLNDPATGPRYVSMQEFNEAYTGIVLTFEPGPGFEKGGVRKSLYKGLRERLRGSGEGLFYAVLTGLALVLPAMVIPIFTKLFIDDILVNKLHYFILPLIIGMIITGFIRALLTWLQQYYILRMETKLSLSTSSKFFWHILRVPVEFFTQRFAGDISSRVAINDRFAQVLSRQLATNILSLIMIFFYLILLFRYNVLLTVIGIIIASLNIVFMQLISRQRKDGNIRLLQERGKLVGTSIAGLTMIETLKASGAEADFYTRWSGYLTKLTNTEQRLNVYTQFLSVIPTFLTSLNTLAILGIGSMCVIRGEMTVGGLVAYQSLMGFFMDPVNKLVNLGSTLQEVEGDMARIDDVLRYRTDPGMSENVKIDTDKDVARKLRGKVELRDITFGYSPLEPPLIENFSISMNPGSRVALVGASGSGKSTISRLITGLYQPWKGEILFDGKPVGEIPRRVITNSISMVDQTIMLYEGTIKDNISMWDCTMNETNILQAARDSSIHDEITAREAGYDSTVEEGGRNFSGGQAQRLEIARALASNPAIMVLDEATSALDPVTEENIDKSLRRRGCTCIIIAHRLSTIRDCDEIIVLDKGKVAQRGTHEQLKDVEGLYNKLIRMY